MDIRSEYNYLEAYGFGGWNLAFWVVLYYHVRLTGINDLGLDSSIVVDYRSTISNSDNFVLRYYVYISINNVFQVSSFCIFLGTCISLYK